MLSKSDIIPDPGYIALIPINFAHCSEGYNHCAHDGFITHVQFKPDQNSDFGGVMFAFLKRAMRSYYYHLPVAGGVCVNYLYDRLIFAQIP